MNWITLSLLSAIFLGLYDIQKKSSLRENAVPPVLLCSVLVGATIWLPLMMLSAAGIVDSSWGELYVKPISAGEHGLLFIKSALVGCSWTCAFFALKHLPISIAAPIRATSPLWTIAIAVLAMGERPSVGQWCGVGIILFAFLAFSQVGKAEGILFERNRWVGLMLVATLLGSFSALYDKYLLQQADFGVGTLQAWFSIYLVPVMLPMWLRWYVVERRSNPFKWRWSIPLIAVCLLIADFLYFAALREPEAMISLISPLRRTSVLITFFAGIWWLKEQNWRAKGICVACLLLGVYLIALAA